MKASKSDRFVTAMRTPPMLTPEQRGKLVEMANTRR
jgi:hypothetical protein